MSLSSSLASPAVAEEEEESPSFVQKVFNEKTMVMFIAYTCYASWAFLMIFQGVLFDHLDHRWKEAGTKGLHSTNKWVWQHSVSLIGFMALIFRIFHNVFFSRLTSRQRVVLCYCALIIGLSPFLVFLFFVHFATSNEPYISRSPFWLLYSSLCCGVAMGAMEPNLQRSLPPHLKPFMFYGMAFGFNLTSIIGFTLLSLGISVAVLLTLLVFCNGCAIFIFTQVLSVDRLRKSDSDYRRRHPEKVSGKKDSIVGYTFDGRQPLDQTTTGFIQVDDDIRDTPVYHQFEADPSVALEDETDASLMPAQSEMDEESDKYPLDSNEKKRLLSGDFGGDVDEWFEFKRALKEWRRWLPQCAPHYAAFMCTIGCLCLFNVVPLYAYDGSHVPLWRDSWSGGGDGVLWIPMPTFFGMVSFVNLMCQMVGPKYVYGRFAKLDTAAHYHVHYAVLFLFAVLVAPLAAGMFGAIQVPLLVMCGMAGVYLMLSVVAALSSRYFDTYVSQRYRLTCYSLWYVFGDVGNFIGFNTFAFVVNYVCRGAPDEHEWHCKD